MSRIPGLNWLESILQPLSFNCYPIIQLNKNHIKILNLTSQLYDLYWSAYTFRTFWSLLIVPFCLPFTFLQAGFKGMCHCTTKEEPKSVFSFFYIFFLWGNQCNIGHICLFSFWIPSYLLPKTFLYYLFDQSSHFLYNWPSLLPVDCQTAGSKSLFLFSLVSVSLSPCLSIISLSFSPYLSVSTLHIIVW